MNKRVIFVVAAIVIVAIIALWGKSYLDERAQSDLVYETAQNTDLSIAFSYPSGDTGYALIEPPTGEGEDLLEAWIMMPAADYLSFQEVEGGEAPASMNVFVFELPDATAGSEEQAGRITRLQNWANDNKNITLIDRAYGTPEIVEIDGVKALQYDTTGLFEQSIYLASYRGYVYMFVGQYDRPTDRIKKDFEELIASVRFE